MAAQPVTSPSQSAGHISSGPASSQRGQKYFLLWYMNQPIKEFTDYHRTALQFKNKQQPQKTNFAKWTHPKIHRLPLNIPAI